MADRRFAPSQSSRCRCAPAVAVVVAVAVGLFGLPAGVAADESAATPGRGAPSLRTIERVLRTPGPGARRLAIAALAKRHNGPERGRARALLVATLADSSALVRLDAIAALPAFGEPEAAADLADRLGAEREPEVLATLILGVAGLDPRGIDPARITPFGSNASPLVRRAAVLALSDMGGADARRLALHLLRDLPERDPGGHVRASSLVALARVGTAADAPHVRAIASAKRQPWIVRAAWPKALLAVSPETAFKPVRSALADPDDRVGVAAAVALGQGGHGEALRAALADPDPKVRAAAIGGVHQVALPGTRDQLRGMARLDRVRTVRWAATTALFRAEDRMADDLVLDALASEEPSLAARARTLLVERTRQHAITFDGKAWRTVLKAWWASR